jgi:hypothetical protein
MFVHIYTKRVVSHRNSKGYSASVTCIQLLSGLNNFLKYIMYSTPPHFNRFPYHPELTWVENFALYMCYAELTHGSWNFAATNYYYYPNFSCS